jgi:3-hydroxyisobutyrate dehydrogenase
VYLDPLNGVLASNVDNKVLIDCSTIDTATSLAVREETLKRYPSAYFVDAPVSGGVLGAQKATLTFMIGAAESDPKLPLLKDLLGKMGTNLVACGGPSLGLTAKLCNNYCSGLIAIAVSEAMNIGIRSGMDPRVLASVFHSSTAQSAICDDWCPVPGLSPEAPASNGYKGGFKVSLPDMILTLEADNGQVQLMRKDFGLAVETAERVGAKLALGQEGLRTYTETMKDERCRDLDSRVVYRYLGGEEDWEEKLKNRQ